MVEEAEPGSEAALPSKPPGSPPTSPRSLSLTRTLSPALSPPRGQLEAPSPGGSGEVSAQASPAGSPAQAPAAARSLRIDLSAVGVGLQFVQLLDDGSGPPGDRPGSGASGGSGASSRHSSVADMGQLLERVQPRRSGSAAEPAHPSSRSVRLLAANLDLQAGLVSKVGGWLGIRMAGQRRASGF